MTIAEFAALTGLTESEAALARQRDFGETFVFEDEPVEKFFRATEAAGLNRTQFSGRAGWNETALELMRHKS